jgi:hypothetical protein
MRGPGLFMLISLASGCAIEISEQGDERTAESAGAIDIDNAMEFNALRPNGIAPNGIAPNGIAPNGLIYTNLSQSAKDALSHGGTAGSLSRMFIHYAVSCAFNSGDSFAYTDDTGTTKHAQGSLGLAPNWKTQGLSSDEQQWVSACIAARTNYLGEHVQISLRANNTQLDLVAGEAAIFNKREGVFWGNLFTASPVVYSCYDPANESNSREKNRFCAVDNTCGLLVSRGRCDQAPSSCTGGTAGGSYYDGCEGEDKVVTTYLQTYIP